MVESFIVRDEGKGLQRQSIKLLDKPSAIKLIDNAARIEIIKALSKMPMYPAELAKALKMHEQLVYYHIKQLMNASIIHVVERQEIRGTMAKKLAVKDLNFAVLLSDDWKDFSVAETGLMDKKLKAFLEPLVMEGELQGKIVVGSPDPHGPFKARARDSHYAIDLSIFLGKYVKMPSDFAVSLDVDINLSSTDTNFLLVGGPVTNLVVSTVQEKMPARFADNKPWGLFSDKTQKKYTEESIGVVAKIPNPHFPNRYVIILAGISSPGTKAAVLALTRHTKRLMGSYTGQKAWSAIVQGFDEDGDGKLDSVEILE
ncbi:MAG: hypothetical protein QS98_C0014G0022 [archaeon GW2011_AR3]|nr:MAG: hypothetical protein QS98_C0014G0022 [archaeon GW2011_AR3]MBS3109257.1 helix-turn-helix domain-containing protein [Candidatus Woesearchaeota archaeon]